ncbi:MAG: ATP-dependent RecD-like DNA helicase [Roseburia sp.]|nr:ATP-dependent RecD-like DNA helicase [Roseburia sp.]
MEERNGYVEHIIYRNVENGYTVFEFACEDEDGEMLETCVGTFPFINEGEYMVLYGNMVKHPTYHEQFKVEKSESRDPDDVVSMQRYLASGAIKGIGGGLAKRITDLFGDRSFEIIEKEPERLSEVKGISEKKAMDIAAQFEEKREMRSALLFLQQYGISNQLAVKIYKTYREDMYGIVKNNPYKLAEDIRGVGFRIADGIAMRTGLDMDSDYRIRAGILYVLGLGTGSGHVYMPEELLYRNCVEFLGVSVARLMNMVDEMEIDKSVIRDGEKVYLPTLYYNEMNCARMLLDIGNVNASYDESLDRVISELQKESEIELDDRQVQAVRESMNHGLLVITGGPGTGKTTTINMIIRLLESEGQTILLAAPTGRAAKRMTETTGRETQTIHRMLQYNGAGMEEKERAFSADSDGQGVFERNEWNPLEADVVIIDEMSMVDIYLFTSLLKAISVGTRLILVGDVNQLPSVGPGNVLKDIIRSGCCSVVRLERIFRQAAESDIVVNAHKINKGEAIKMDNQSRDFFCLEKEDSHSVLEVMLWLVRDKMPKYTQCTPFDVQVLTPMKKGELGVVRCNQILQKYLNPQEEGKAQMEVHGTVFREGDKVMQIKNNYQMPWRVEGFHGVVIEEGTGVFNGDCGIIRQIDLMDKEMVVAFDEEKLVTYSFGDMDELELAYAITIHKSQGSEYPAVVLPILSGPRVLMNRNLLYTAVTRGKKCVTIVGSKRAVSDMIVNQSEQKRYSTLEIRLKELQYD